MVGRKWKQHHNVSRCVEHMLCCAGTEMCKCNAQFLSLSDFRKYSKWKWMVLWFLNLSSLLGPGSCRRFSCKHHQKKSSTSALWHKAQSCCKYNLHTLLPVHLHFWSTSWRGNRLVSFKSGLIRTFIVPPTNKMRIFPQVHLLLSEVLWLWWLLTFWQTIRYWYYFQAGVIFPLCLCSVRFLQLQECPCLLQKLAHHSHGTKHINIRRDLPNQVKLIIFAMYSLSSEFKVPMRTDRGLRTSIPCFQNLGHKAHQFLEVEAG